MLRLMEIQESCREENKKLNFLGIFWERKGPKVCIFQVFKEPVKSKILAAMVPPQRYSEFITDLSS